MLTFGLVKNLFFMKLFILRHGKAEDIKENLKDFDRKLSSKGVKQAHKLGRYLSTFKIEQIISSSANRTKETTEIVNEYCHTKTIMFDKDLYLADVNTIKKKIAKLATKENVLFVGHNYGISDLVTDLTGHDTNLSTCALAIVDLQINDWGYLAGGTGILEQIIIPKQL
jgi:phosphohistidine phosphatase